MQLYGVVLETGSYSVVLEYIEHGSLDDFISTYKVRGTEEVNAYCILLGQLGGQSVCKCGCDKKDFFQMWVRQDRLLSNVGATRKTSFKCGSEKKDFFQMWVRQERLLSGLIFRGLVLGGGSALLRHKILCHRAWSSVRHYQPASWNCVDCLGNELCYQ